MKTVSCMQMVFCRVEEDYSPALSTGYQTVYKSRGIEEYESEYVEKRIRCFKPRSDDDLRYQFFVIPGGKVVVTHSIPIESDPIIVDKARRGGMFLAHCLLIEPGEFKRINNNPFDIFDNAKFLSSAREMVDEFLSEKRNEDIHYINIYPSTKYFRASRWDSEAVKLYSLAKAAPTITSNSMTSLIISSREEIEYFLRAVFHFTPPKLRISCSFDTSIDDCDVQAGQFWIAGSLKSLNKSFVNLDISGNSLALSVDPPQQTDCYFNWLQEFQKSGGEELYERVPKIQDLCEAIHNKRIPAKELLKDEIILPFFSINKTFIKERLTNALSQDVPIKIVEELSLFIMQSYDPMDVIKHAATQEITPEYGAGYIHNWIIHNTQHLDILQDEDWVKIFELADKAQDTTLLFWLSIFTENSVRRNEAIRKMSKEEFLDALFLLQNPISASHFVNSRFSSILLNKLIPLLGELTNDQFIELVEAIVSIEVFDDLNVLSDRVLLLDSRDLRKLNKVIKNIENLPLDFQNAITMRRNEIWNKSKLSKLWKKPRM